MSLWDSINLSRKPRVLIRTWGFSVRPTNQEKASSRQELSRVHPLFTWTFHLHAGAK